MDLTQAEQTLAAAAKVFRLSRLYPATHPAVARAEDELAAALPALAARGVADWKVRAQGVFYRERQLQGRNHALLELVQLLFSRGVRGVRIAPGTTVEHVRALIRVATGAAEPTDAALGPIELSVGRRASAAAGPAGLRLTSVPRARSRQEALRPSRSTDVAFEPDVLPADVDARRWLEVFQRDGEPTARAAALARLEELGTALADLRDPRLVAEVIGALHAASMGGDDAVPRERVQALADRLVDHALLAQLVRRVGEPGVPPDERRVMVRSVGAVAARAVPLIIDVYVKASPEARAAYRAAARAAGEEAVAPLLARLGTGGADAVAAALDLLGATGSPTADERMISCLEHASPIVREHALGALAEIGATTLGRCVASRLKDPVAAVRRAAVRALVAAHEAGGTALTLARLKDEEDEGVVVELLGALGRLGGADVVESLAEYTESGVLRAPFPSAVRVAAAKALATLGIPEAREKLMTLTTDRDPEVRDVARGATA